MGINLVSATVVAGIFAIIIYRIKMLSARKPEYAGGAEDDEEEI